MWTVACDAPGCDAVFSGGDCDGIVAWTARGSADR
jgi:hypothetical protein